MPYHALAGAAKPGQSQSACPEWTCLPGFFRTAPAVPDLATCKPCSIRACEAGLRLVACTPLADAACVPCDAQPPPNSHFLQAGCNATVCDDGWYSGPQQQWCAVCPMGSFCSNGVQTQCGVNTITPDSGASSILDCIPSNPASDGVGLIVSIDYSMLNPTQQRAAACGKLQTVMAWLQYGMLLGCQASERDISGLNGVVLCSVITSKAAAAGGAYVTWLADRLAAMGPVMQAALSTCFLSPDLVISDSSITAQPVSDMLRAYAIFEQGVEQGESIYFAAPQQPPALAFDAIKWGQQPQDAVAVLAAVGILGTTMPIALAMLVASICARRRHQQALNQITADMVRHRERLLQLAANAAAPN